MIDDEHALIQDVTKERVAALELRTGALRFLVDLGMGRRGCGLAVSDINVMLGKLRPEFFPKARLPSILLVASPRLGSLSPCTARSLDPTWTSPSPWTLSTSASQRPLRK